MPFITHEGRKLQQQPVGVSGRKTAADQLQAEFFYAHKQRERLSHLGSSHLLRRMGARCAAWLQKQIMSMGEAGNIFGSRHCSKLFVYCFPWLLAGQLSVFWRGCVLS